MQAADLKGVASSVGDNKQIYTEVHKITVDNNRLNKKIQTKYYKPDGKLFAEMTSNFVKNVTLPDVKFSDSRFEKTEELNFDENKKTMTFVTTSGGKKTISKEFKVTEDMAAGQGFDNFVKLNFDKLKLAATPLTFGVLSQMDFFSFKGYKKKDIDENIVQFGIELSNFFLRMMSSELVLEYDSQTKQILSYKGLSNILTDDGKTQDVLIKYETIPVESSP